MRTWCEHVKWHSSYRYWYLQDRFDADKRNYQSSRDVQRDWKFCPICGAKRPEEKKPERLAEIVREAGRKYAVDNGYILPSIKVKSEDEFFGAIAHAAIEAVKKTGIITPSQ